MHKLSSILVSKAAGLAVLVNSSVLLAEPCEALNLPGTLLYGSGGSAVTPILRSIAVELTTLPEPERITILYADEGAACGGYGWWRAPAETDVNFKFWDENNVQDSCQAPQTVIQFAHMGHTPALCPGDVPIPSDAAKFAASVSSANFITAFASEEESISAEAAYHIFGFGAGVYDIKPWNEPEAIFIQQPSAFVSQLIGNSIGVPADQLFGEIPNTASGIASYVATWPHPDEPLGYVYGSIAQVGEYSSPSTIKTLAYQHYDQSCAYLPDSSRTRPDRANVRSGQYFIWTPSWFYTHVDDDGVPTNHNVRKLIGWVDGSLGAPDGIPVREIIISAGDIPLCAMQAIRPEGDLTAVQSYAHPRSCNGWYEFIATGSSSYEECSSASDCNENSGEVCRYGYCEAY